jgi:AcrR family transcriptional regulator
MAKMRTPRELWIAAGLEVLAEGGPGAVRVEVLARRLGVTKGGFYGHFSDREELLGAMLDSWERRSGDEVVARVDEESGTRLERAVRAADLTFSEELRPIDMAVRDWARRDHAVAARLRRLDNQRMDLLRRYFEQDFPDPADLEARCFLAFSVAVAGDLIAADHPGRTRSEVVEAAAGLLFSPPATPGPGTRGR